MASLVGGVVGAVIGGFISGWNPQVMAIGWAIGSGVGSYLGAPNVEGPRLQDRNVQVSSYGVAIPKIYGTVRVAGNVIWPRNFTVDEHSHSQSAKGGGEQKTFTYSATFAVLLGEPIAGLSKIWMNKKLVYDVSATPSTDPICGTFRVYLGTETQTPDPLMVARDGSAPAYRGSSYIVFDSVELTNSGFGNRPPVVEAEVFTNGIPVPHGLPVYLGTTETVPSSFQPIASVDPTTEWIWTANASHGAGQVSVTVVSDVGEMDIVSIIQANASVDHACSVCYVGSEVWVLCATLFANNPAIIARFSSGLANPDGSANVAPAFIGWYTVSDGPNDPAAMSYDPINGNVWIAYAYNNLSLLIVAAINPLTRTTTQIINVGYALGYIYDICIGGTYMAVAGYSGPSGNPNFAVFDITTFTKLYTLQLATPSNINGKGVDYDPIRKCFLFLQSGVMTYQTIAASTGAITSNTLSLASGHDTSPAPNVSAYDSVCYLPSLDRYLFGSDAGSGTGTTLYVVNPDSFVVEYTFTYESGSTNLLMGVLLAPATNGRYVLSFDLTHVKRLYIGSVVGGPVTLGSIVSDLCTDEGGLLVGDIDVSQLTELVDGYLVGNQMTRRAAIQPLQAAFFFDAVESDHILKFPKRGQSPVVTIPKDDRAAHLFGSAVTPHLSITRIPELELPWMIDVSYMDKTKDYQIGDQYDRRITRNSSNPVNMQLPIVMSPSKAKQVAMVNLYLAWARVQFNFETTLKYAAYMPTDVVVIPTDNVTYIARLTSRLDLGNGIIKWDAIIEDIAVYTQSPVIAASNFAPQTISNPGVTILELIDAPILRDVDDDPGFYTTAKGTTTGWRGAILYKSIDGGSSYSQVLSYDSPAAIGSAQNALGNFTGGNNFDEANTVTISIFGSTLTSATAIQVLAGVNLAVIGSPGRWEVIGFKNATLIAANTYRLSGLLRGRRGTDWAMGTHATSDVFILADDTKWKRINPGAGDIGLSRLYRAPAIGTLLSSAAAVNFTNTAIGSKPYAPVYLSGSRDASGNITGAWVRRTRVGGEWRDSVDVPVGEASESYDVEVWNSTYTTLKRTFAGLTTPALSYTSAQQVTDFGSNQNPVYLRIYQNSAVVGRGYKLEGTI